MILAIALLINNIGLFIIETIAYHVCHSGKLNCYVMKNKYIRKYSLVVILLDGYYHLCQAILCTVRIVSRMVNFETKYKEKKKSQKRT